MVLLAILVHLHVRQAVTEVQLFVNDILDLFDNAKCDPVKLHTELIYCLMQRKLKLLSLTRAS